MRQFKAEGLRDALFAGTPETFFIQYLLAKVASCKDFGLLVVDISVALMHLCTIEQMRKFYVKVPSCIKSSGIWRLEAAVNGTRKESKHWQEFSCDKLVTKKSFFQQNDINPCIYKTFCVNLDHNLEVLANEFKNNFLVKKAEIVSLKPEHQNEIHFLKRRISVDNFGWHVELDQGYVKSLLDAMAMNHCKSMASWIEGAGEQSKYSRFDRKVGSAGTRVPIRCWNERGSRTDHSLKDKIEGNCALPQRTSAMCTEFPLGEKAGRRHPCVTVDADWAGDPKTRSFMSGGVLATGPCFTVRHWSVTQATVSLSSAESEAKAVTKGCIEALYVKHLLEHQTARPFKIEVWTDSSSAKATMLRLGPGRRAKHLEVQTMWVQQLNKIGLISLNKLGTLENVADLLTTRSKSSTRQAGRNDGLHTS